MQIEVREEEYAVVLVVNGRLTMKNSHELLLALKKSISQGAARILVQLGRVDYMDSSGVGVLITGMKLARKQNAVLGLVALTERVRQVLEMSGLLSLFSVFDNLETARAGLN